MCSCMASRSSFNGGRISQTKIRRKALFCKYLLVILQLFLIYCYYQNIIFFGTQVQILKYKFTNTNSQIQIHKYKYTIHKYKNTNTNTLIQIHNYTYTNTNTPIGFGLHAANRNFLYLYAEVAFYWWLSLSINNFYIECPVLLKIKVLQM